MFRAKRLIRPAFDCHLGIGAEVDEEPEFATRKFEVIVEKLISEIPMPHYTKNKKTRQRRVDWLWEVDSNH